MGSNSIIEAQITLREEQEKEIVTCINDINYFYKYYIIKDWLIDEVRKNITKKNHKGIIRGIVLLKEDQVRRGVI